MGTLNVHIETLRRWDKQGRLETIRIGKRCDRRYQQEDIIKQSTQKANEAGIQVRDIAIKAIEGASGHRLVSGRYFEGNEISKG